jgi:type IV secretion system protein VirB11
LRHPNRVALYYSEGGQDATGVTAALLVKASLRLRIGRLLLQELRDGASTLAFLHALQTGHSGAITTVHAPHAAGAFDRLRVLIKSHPDGAAVSDSDIMTKLRELIDVVIHCARDGDRFWLSEVWFAAAEAA